ncbi:MAG: hypothetical protein NVSMB14_15020 [Isosphaeraceae bacterium]
MTLTVLPTSVITARSDTMDSLMMLLLIGVAWLLLRYAERARKLSIGTAIVRIAQLISTTSFQIGFILPYIARQTAAAANSKNAAIVEFGNQNRVIYAIWALIFMILSMIYPIVSIVLLNLKGPRELCRASKPAKLPIHPNPEFE